MEKYWTLVTVGAWYRTHKCHWMLIRCRYTSVAILSSTSPCRPTDHVTTYTVPSTDRCSLNSQKVTQTNDTSLYIIIRHIASICLDYIVSCWCLNIDIHRYKTKSLGLQHRKWQNIKQLKIFVWNKRNRVQLLEIISADTLVGIMLFLWSLL